MSERARIGRPAPRIDGEAKVTGRAAYAGDQALRGMLYAGILRCPLPHARILKVDTSAAETIEGVRAVLCSDNVGDYAWYDEDVPLFSDIARFAGDEVAAVAATTREALDDALAAIRVDYEALPFVVDIEAAKADGAPLVHADSPKNLAREPQPYERGDCEAGFAAADVIVEQTYTTQCAVHNAMEPHGCTAEWHDGQLVLWVSTQGIFSVRDGIAEKLGLPEERVRVVCDYMGGGFGAKQIDWKQTLVAALLARATGQPVQLLLDRRGENLAVGNRNATTQRVRLGADVDGRLRAISVEVDCAIGAYSSGGEASDIVGIYQKLYACDNVRTVQRDYYTNTGPAVAFRAPGYAEGAFALEQAMDELADRLGIPPVAIRERNYVRIDQSSGKPYSAPDALSACLAAIGPATVGGDDARLQYGTGVAACVWMAGTANPPATVRLRLYRHGALELLCGSQDIGTGTRTVVAQIAADILDYPLESIRVLLGDTQPGLEAPTSSGSCTLATLAPAVRSAAEMLLGKLGDADGRSLQARAAGIEGDYLEATGECPDGEDDVSIRTFGAQRADVAVDPATGEVTVTRLAVAADCGCIVNPLLAYGQVMGGALQGLGFALTEERVVDTALGLVMNANLEDYEVPTAADAPVIDHCGIDQPDSHTPGPHVKGLGEPPVIPAAPAIANAIFAATGVRITSLPMGRARLLEALADARRSG